MKKHVLLIDDDKDQLQIFMDAFDSDEVPCKCTYVQQFDHALKMLQYLHPDCIFIRIDLLDQDAMKFLNALKSDERLSDINIVMYSDNLDSATIRQAIYQGADFCVKKPVGAGELQRLLAEIFIQQNPMYAVHRN